MRIYGKINKIQGKHVELSLDDKLDLERLSKFSLGQSPVMELRLHDKREISNKQRRKCFAMFHDIANYTGYSIFEAESWLKAYYMVSQGKRYFSLSDTSVTNAKEFIDYIIKFCFLWNIPFKYKTYSELRDDYTFQRQCLLKRRCVICGAKADIDHWFPVGRQNRWKIDNTQFRFCALCRKHHTEKHQLSRKVFQEKYHIRIIPMKLNHDEIKKLHIGG